jgi:hypothetical protein
VRACNHPASCSAIVRPSNTLVRADLVGDEYLVGMEAAAVVGDGR